MSEIKALEVSIEENLRPLSVYLWRSGLAHRIIEQAGQQVVLVRTPMQAEAVRDLHAQMRRGEVLPLPELPVSGRGPLSLSLRTSTPVTFIFIALSVIGFFVGGFNSPLESKLTFFPFDQLGNYTFFSLAGGEYWRLFTPMFLHFSLQHIIFNMLLFWFWGKKIELTQGGLRLFAIVMLMAMGSNIAQALFAGVSIFGGMSGVDFGLFGYCLSWSLLFPKSVLRVEKPFIVMMLVTLVFGFINLTKLLGMGAVANVAHVSGLLLGLVLGFAMGIIAKVER